MNINNKWIQEKINRKEIYIEEITNEQDIILIETSHPITQTLIKELEKEGYQLLSIKIGTKGMEAYFLNQNYVQTT